MTGGGQFSTFNGTHDLGGEGRGGNFPPSMELMTGGAEGQFSTLDGTHDRGVGGQFSQIRTFSSNKFCGEAATALPALLLYPSLHGNVYLSL